VPTNTGMTEWDFDEETGQWTLRTYDDARHLASLVDDGDLEL
jgi:hypothetical protein